MPTGHYRTLKVFSIVGRHLRSSAPCSWPTRARAAACWCFVSNALHPISTRRLTAACRAQTPADSWGACARSGSRHKPRSRHTLITRLCTGLELRARWPRGSRSCARSGSSTRTRACTSTSRTSVLSTRHGSQIEHFGTRPCPQCPNTHCLTDLWSWQVGAASLNATLNCEDFATAHSSTAHFDIKARLPLFSPSQAWSPAPCASQSFVGLAWRPVGESICCGALQTAAMAPLRARSLTNAVRCAQRCTAPDEPSALF